MTNILHAVTVLLVLVVGMKPILANSVHRLNCSTVTEISLSSLVDSALLVMENCDSDNSSGVVLRVAGGGTAFPRNVTVLVANCRNAFVDVDGDGTSIVDGLSVLIDNVSNTVNSTVHGTGNNHNASSPLCQGTASPTVCRPLFYMKLVEVIDFSLFVQNATHEIPSANALFQNVRLVRSSVQLHNITAPLGADVILLLTTVEANSTRIHLQTIQTRTITLRALNSRFVSGSLLSLSGLESKLRSITSTNQKAELVDDALIQRCRFEDGSSFLMANSSLVSNIAIPSGATLAHVMFSETQLSDSSGVYVENVSWFCEGGSGRVTSIVLDNCEVTNCSGLFVRNVVVRGTVDHTVVYVSKTTIVSTPMDISDTVLNIEQPSSYTAYVLRIADATAFGYQTILMSHCAVNGTVVGLFAINPFSSTSRYRVQVTRANIVLAHCVVTAAAHAIGLFTVTLELGTTLQLNDVSVQGHSALIVSDTTLSGGGVVSVINSKLAASFPLYFLSLTVTNADVRLDNTTLVVTLNFVRGVDLTACFTALIWNAVNATVTLRGMSFYVEGSQYIPAANKYVNDANALRFETFQWKNTSLVVDFHRFGGHVALLHTTKSGVITLADSSVSLNASKADLSAAAAARRNLSSVWTKAFVELSGATLVRSTFDMVMPIGGVSALVEPSNSTDIAAFLNVADCQLLYFSRIGILSAGASSPVSWGGALLKATRVHVKYGSVFRVRGLYCNATDLALMTVTDSTVSGAALLEIGDVVLSARRSLPVMYGMALQHTTVFNDSSIVIGNVSLGGSITLASCVSIVSIIVDSKSLLDVVNLSATMPHVQRGVFAVDLTVRNASTVTTRDCDLPNVVAVGAHLQQVKLSNSTLNVLANSTIATAPGFSQAASGVLLMFFVGANSTIVLFDGATIVGRFRGVVVMDNASTSNSNVSAFCNAVVRVSVDGAPSCTMCSRTGSLWVRCSIDSTSANIHTTTTDGNESSTFDFGGSSVLQHVAMRIDAANCTGSQRFLHIPSPSTGSTFALSIRQSTITTRNGAVLDIAGSFDTMAVDVEGCRVSSQYESNGTAIAGGSCAAGECSAVVFLHDMVVTGRVVLLVVGSIATLATTGGAEGSAILLHNATLAAAGANVSFEGSKFAPMEVVHGVRVSFLYATSSVRFAQLRIAIAHAAIVEVAGPTHAIVQAGAAMGTHPHPSSSAHAVTLDVANSTMVVHWASSSVFAAVGPQALDFGIALDRVALVGYAQVVTAVPLSLLLDDAGDPQQQRSCTLNVYCSTVQRHLWSPPSWLGVGRLHYASLFPPVLHNSSRDGRTVCPAALQINKLSASSTFTVTESVGKGEGPPQRDVDAAVNVVAASSLVGSVGFPSGALATRRLSLLIALGSCEEDDFPSPDEVLANEIDFMSSPTRMAFGVEHGAIHRGAVVGNVLLWVACCVAAGVATLAVHFTRMRHQSYRRVSWQGIVTTAASLRLPGLYFIIVALLLQQVLVSSLLLLLYPAPPAQQLDDAADATTSTTTVDWALVDKVVGASGCVVVLVVMGAVARVLDPRSTKFRAVARHVAPKAARGDAPLQTLLYNLTRTSVVWCARNRTEDASFVQRYGFLFEGSNDRRHWWVLVELLMTVVLSVIGSTVPTTQAECLAAVWMGVVVCALGLVATLWLRPMNNMLESIIVYLLAAAQLCIAFFGALDAPPTASDAMGIGAAVFSACLVLASLWHVLQTHLKDVLASTTASRMRSAPRDAPSRAASPMGDAPISTATDRGSISEKPVVAKQLEQLIRAICASKRGSARTVVRFVGSSSGRATGNPQRDNQRYPV